MPIYEYQCEKCKRHHEVAQKMSDPPLTRCPECKGKLQKLISLAGFQLKGGGWYKDGYASAKLETKPETKPEAKPDSLPPNPPQKTEVPTKSSKKNPKI